ncbi:MAG TPA: threonine synthase [Rubrobacteraceae bacterium]|nr:threonine synthase [Rubrobacteraceae bacterium]
MTIAREYAQPTGSTLTHLEGALSGKTYPADELAGLDPADGRPLLARYDMQRAARTLTVDSLAHRRTGGMWRWAELLPLRDWNHVIHLGEGDTPLLPQLRLGKALGVSRLATKAEGLNPTGSFKARGMAAAVSRGLELGATSFVAPSAGNAGGALAAYGAAAGVEVTVLLPADATDASRDEVLAMGARLVLVDGLINDCGRIAAALADRTGAFDLSTLKEPYRVEGKKTMGFELAEQRGWRLPDVIVYPTGGGTGLVGMWKAFAELEALDLIGSQRPRMVSVQAEGCAPIVQAFENGERFAEPWEDAHTRASGIRVPSAVGDFLILDAVQRSEGTAVAVDEGSIADMQLFAGRLGAGYVSPESAAALAAVPDLRIRGEIGREDEVVVFDCGIGQKYPPPPTLPDPPLVDPANFDLEMLVDQLGETGR